MNENEQEPGIIRRHFGTILILAICLAAYSFFTNIYLSMIAYLALSMCLVSFCDIYANDLIKLLLIIGMPLAAGNFSVAYKIFLCGILMQTMGINQDKIYMYSSMRRRYGSLFAALGTLLLLTGAVMGIYNILF